MAVPADDLTCRELVELVTEYLEGALDRRERVRFEAHLAHCPECRVHLEHVRATLAVLGRTGHARLSPAAEQALFEAFRGWKRGARASRVTPGPERGL